MFSNLHQSVKQTPLAGFPSGSRIVARSTGSPCRSVTLMRYSRVESGVLAEGGRTVRARPVSLEGGELPPNGSISLCAGEVARLNGSSSAGEGEAGAKGSPSCANTAVAESPIRNIACNNTMDWLWNAMPTVSQTAQVCSTQSVIRGPTDLYHFFACRSKIPSPMHSSRTICHASLLRCMA